MPVCVNDCDITKNNSTKTEYSTKYHIVNVLNLYAK